MNEVSRRVQPSRTPILNVRGFVELRRCVASGVVDKLKDRGFKCLARGRAKLINLVQKNLDLRFRCTGRRDFLDGLDCVNGRVLV